MHPDVHCNTIYNSQDMEATSMSINRGMDKEDRYIYNGILLSHEKEWNHAICRDVAGTRDCHTEWSKSERERPTCYYTTHVYGIWKKLYR